MSKAAEHLYTTQPHVSAVIKSLERNLIFSCPILAAKLLQQFYSMADAAVLGHFAEKMSLAAVESSSLLLSVVLNFFTGFTTGIGVLISQYFGKREYERVKHSIETALMTCLSVGVIFIVVGILFGRT